MNIFEKMQKVTDEMSVVVKGLNVQVNKTSSYKAVSERDILDNVKPLETKYGIYSYPFARKVIDSDTLVKETEFVNARTDDVTTTKTNTLFMRLETIYRFVNIEKPEEYVDITTYGDGLDTGDKAPGKAMTYADKYALMKAYKISTGDDPDKEPSPENGYKKAVSKESKATPKQIELLLKIYKDDNLNKLLELNNITKIEDITMQKASELISKNLKKKEEN